MPIRPENRRRYPADWPAISRRIRQLRSGGRCECTGECGLDHAEEGRIVTEAMVHVLFSADGRCAAEHGRPHPVTFSRVVLTVAHLDHQPENCAETNLRAMCQRCHNRLDAPHRRAGIADRERRRRAVGDLFTRDA